jgi:fatty acid desaturase
MEEAFAPAGAIDKKELKALSARSDAKGLLRFASHLVALTATGALIALGLGTSWLVPALVLHGVVLVFLFAPLHETIHYTAFRNRRLNQAVAWLCGMVLALPPGFFHTFHFAHHRDTQDPARDPELVRPKPRSLADYLVVLSGLPYWRERIGTTLRHALGRVDEPFVPARRRMAVAAEARVLLAIYGLVAAASVVLESPAALLYWLAPVVLGQPALRVFLLAEHTGCPLVPGMLENSRTTPSNALVRWLTWNMGFHAEHHAYPALPFHALPQAHERLKDRITIQAPGYLAAHRQIRAGLGGYSPA